jgi:hypothetical protein
MRIINSLLLIVILTTALAQGAESMEKNLTPEAVVAGFDQRVEAMFRAESGKPLVRTKKQKPRPGTSTCQRIIMP